MKQLREYQINNAKKGIDILKKYIDLINKNP